MKLILTCQHDGSYMLTAFKPLIDLVRGTEHSDVFVRPGEPVGVRHLCRDGVKAFFGIKLNPLESVWVELTATVLRELKS